MRHFPLFAFYDLHDMSCIYLPPQKTYPQMNHTTPASTHQIVPCLATVIIPLAGTPGDTSTCAGETGSGIHLGSGEMTKPDTSKHLLRSFFSPKHLFRRPLGLPFTPSHQTGGFWMSREGTEIAGRFRNQVKSVRMLVILGRMIFCGDPALCVCNPKL